ncbi:13502_t:CDS:2 [Cetraspora pellucida]|uniref:13502_t:CDS:1 n=1 Tax=Cetraspora pellucida TaxID=1433469 RepID=A0A9N9NYP1_9GLOM|nr:13502_t:CDS:2 [Cetraspora pellucida]
MSQQLPLQLEQELPKAYKANLIFDKNQDLSEHVFKTCLDKICKDDPKEKSIFLIKLKEFCQLRCDMMTEIKFNCNSVRNREDSNYERAKNLFEETKLDLKDFYFIAYDEGFHIFSDCSDHEIMFKTEAYTINEFKNLKVTNFLRLKESVIIEAINSKFRNHRKHKNEINHVNSQKQVKIDPKEPESTTSSLFSL